MSTDVDGGAFWIKFAQKNPSQTKINRKEKENEEEERKSVFKKENEYVEKMSKSWENDSEQQNRSGECGDAGISIGKEN